MKNASQKFKMDEIMAAICNLHLYYNFALVSHEKYTLFQPVRRA